MRRHLNTDERNAVAAALWLVLRDKSVHRAFVDLTRDNREDVEQAMESVRSAYNAIVSTR